MRILITGHKGFIGAELSKLLSTEHEIVGLDTKQGDNLLTCDLPKNIDLVIHLAGKSGVRQSLTNAQLYWDNNVEVSKRLFHHYRNRRVIYASSSTAHEPTLNPYAASKLLTEHAASEYSNTLGLRFHTVYSENCPRENMFISRLLNNKLEYTTNHYRDFIHVSDICDCIKFLITQTISGVIDVGTGESISIEKLSPGLPLNLNTPGERLITQADTSKLEELGWKHKINFKDFLTSQGFEAIL